MSTYNEDLQRLEKDEPWLKTIPPGTVDLQKTAKIVSRVMLYHRMDIERARRRVGNLRKYGLKEGINIPYVHTPRNPPPDPKQQTHPLDDAKSRQMVLPAGLSRFDVAVCIYNESLFHAHEWSDEDDDGDLRISPERWREKASYIHQYARQIEYAASLAEEDE